MFQMVPGQRESPALKECGHGLSAELRTTERQLHLTTPLSSRSSFFPGRQRMGSLLLGNRTGHRLSRGFQWYPTNYLKNNLFSLKATTCVQINSLFSLLNSLKIKKNPWIWITRIFYENFHSQMFKFSLFPVFLQQVHGYNLGCSFYQHF